MGVDINKGYGNVINTDVYDKNFISTKSNIDNSSILKEKCVIQDEVEICEFSSIKNTTIKKETHVVHSYIEDSEIGENCSIGPFARIRPNTKIGDNVKVGNFVEIKNSTISNGTKISHLAYVGDAEIGENCNICCGVIFANYNGRNKNKIVVGNNCFIGSNCNLIAPLTIADNTYICAGTTVTDNTNEYDFVIGRSKQVTKPMRAKNYLKEK